MSSTAMMAARPAGQSFGQWLKKTLFYMNGYHKYGLMSNDIVYVTPEVREALKRLSKKEYDERYYRMARAINIYLHGQLLPQNEWIKFEEDKKYLQPYIDQVKREMADKKLFDKS